MIDTFIQFVLKLCCYLYFSVQLKQLFVIDKMSLIGFAQNTIQDFRNIVLNS